MNSMTKARLSPCFAHALCRAIDIFGPQHADLYNLFESLLSKHMTGSF